MLMDIMTHYVDGKKGFSLLFQWHKGTVDLK
jgi:hypothetical protein